ncbi:hypothetical protein [Cyclobacterium marinum]|uniref:TonB-dependent receptor plug n=1 Tax=Cyclobacterium marinum (strain ATCC 25205 / DSM 745 / LMG 13164 / NCIMB 1802) TaxID=880070 RepID=G0J2R5_CYCMS|nr:hypothetical protein [Cyclobacterium marinum]AEL26648.1 hypothetical protein Cycma_2912 [Cyclobacterium marinum DSM 745]MBR9778053.1 hypothetical protein [Cytophagales bacterium]|tara:strand:- start:7911 stop:8612 length:702 start_codon:yes stop_codon:yes gene_type:complete
MKKLFIIGIILCSGVLNAQDIFQQNLYSANLVFQNSFAISLSDQQLEKITKIHSQSSKEFFTGKLDLDEASAKLKKMLSATKPNPEAVIRQLDIVLNLENSLKKKKLSTLVAIKNELSETQQKELSELKGVSDIDDYDFSNKPLVVGPLNIVDGKNPNLKMRVSGDSENSPLMLLSTKDGMVEIEDIEKINSEDISGMSVIKNKWAIDKYGEKGKNGVLIITLKKDMQEQFEK